MDLYLRFSFFSLLLFNVPGLLDLENILPGLLVPILLGPLETNAEEWLPGDLNTQHNIIL